MRGRVSRRSDQNEALKIFNYRIGKADNLLIEKSTARECKSEETDKYDGGAPRAFESGPRLLTTQCDAPLNGPAFCTERSYAIRYVG